VQSIRTMAALLALATSIPAFAGKPTLLLTPVGYAPDASVPEKVKTECKLDDLLTMRVGERLRKKGSNGSGTTTSIDTAAGTQVMKVQVTFVLGVGGGSFTGPKTVSLRADLLEQGLVRRSEKFSRTTHRGFMGTCALIERCVNALAEDLQEWSDADIDVPQAAPVPQAAAE